MTTKMGSPDQRIVFFDGHCVLCNGFVDFLLRHDHQRRLRFAPLQGSTAQTYLNADQRESNTVLLWSHGRVLSRSTAALTALSSLGGIFRLARVLQWIPMFFRDGVYNFVARNRYRWFGRREECRLPGPEEKEVLLP